MALSGCEFELEDAGDSLYRKPIDSKQMSLSDAATWGQLLAKS